MCGIVAYVGKKNAQSLLLEGLKRLEYRGYDSAGICIGHDGNSTSAAPSDASASSKAPSKTPRPQLPAGHIGMAHTRWATHGAPTEINAHPHLDDHNRIALVHNGIIENYATLKAIPRRKKATPFPARPTPKCSPMLIAHFYKAGDNNGTGSALAKAVQAALHEARGTYGIAVMAADEPDTLVVARAAAP